MKFKKLIYKTKLEIEPNKIYNQTGDNCCHLGKELKINDSIPTN